MTDMSSTSWCLHSEFVCLFFLQVHLEVLDGKTDLLTGLVTGKHDWKYFVTLLPDLLWIQIAQSYLNGLRFSNLPVLNPIVTL
jgi:hypothetical protein